MSAARAVETIACDASHAGKTVYVAGLNEEVAGVLEGLGSDHCIPKNTRFEQRLDAIKAAVTEVKGQSNASDIQGGSVPQGT